MKNKDVNLEQEKKHKGRDFFDSLLIAFVIAMIIRTFLLSAYKIPTGSMLNTLLEGDHIIASKISYIVGKPQFGDIAIFEYPLMPELDFIKRVVGVPGDEIEMVDKVIYRNGEVLDEPYVIKGYVYTGKDNFEKFKVPEGMYLMLGDNRDSSRDSRFWGLVPEKAFKGKALFIYWSKVPGGKVRWDRLLSCTK